MSALRWLDAADCPLLYELWNSIAFDHQQRRLSSMRESRLR